MEFGDLSSLSPVRRKAVEAWLWQPVGLCRSCGQAVDPTDRRARDPQEKDEDAATLLHLSCFEGDVLSKKRKKQKPLPSVD